VAQKAEPKSARRKAVIRLTVSQRLAPKSVKKMALQENYPRPKNQSGCNVKIALHKSDYGQKIGAKQPAEFDAVLVVKALCS